MIVYFGILALAMAAMLICGFQIGKYSTLQKIEEHIARRKHQRALTKMFGLNKSRTLPVAVARTLPRPACVINEACYRISCEDCRGSA